MRKGNLLKLIAAGVLFLICGTAAAQYYDWGRDPASVRWREYRTKERRMIFPEGYERGAARVFNYMDTVSPFISYGFTYRPMRMPVILHTRNLSPNGIVMQAPRRIELIVAPPASTHATPWLKQLSIHEYRHAAQFGNLNKNFIRVLGILLGQQGELVGAALMPQWAMEGDAVIAETQMASFGRGLQPSFTIDYRAMALEGGKRYRTDKFFGGSYKDRVPSHYNLGYQINTYAWQKYGENIWDKIARYSTRNPYLIVTSLIGQKKYYNTYSGKLLHETFDDLNAFWRSLPEVENSSRIVSPPARSFTQYTSPVAVSDTAAVSIKCDFDRYWRLVETDMRSGSEKTLCHVGEVNSGLTWDGVRFWWTELRQSTFWEQKVNSVPCWYEPGSGKSGTLRTDRQAMFAAGVAGVAGGGSGGGNGGGSAGGDPATVEYGYSGVYSIRRGEWSVALPDTISVHGFDYDQATKRFYFIGLSDGGMWIGSAREGADGFRMETRPSYSTLDNLRARGGKLWFTSISSGKDEAHMYDLAEGKEYRITASRYGSFAPYPTPAGDAAVVATYTKEGYQLAVQRLDGGSMTEVGYSRLPKNLLNPERIKWDVPNADLVRAADVDTLGVAAKRYRKGLHLFQVHSWAPVYFEPFELTSELSPNIHFGATILSQNHLNSVKSTFGYGYTDEGSLIKGIVNFNALAPKFEIEAEYGTMDQLVYGPADMPPGQPLSDYFSMTARVYLPAMLSAGYLVTRLTPMVELEHTNALLAYPHTDHVTYRPGLQKLTASILYSGNVRQAYRDFLPRLGYAIQLSAAGNPFNEYINEVYSVYGRLLLPGILPHHSLSLRGALQNSTQVPYYFRQKILFPRGADYDIDAQKYRSLSVDYQFPLWYPDWGIRSVIFIKRVRVNLSADYARYKEFPAPGGKASWQGLSSFGLSVTLDASVFRLPQSATTSFTISIYKPSDSGTPVVSGGISVPL